MGFVRIFWKSNVQRAYLPKMSISGQIVPEIFWGLTQKNLEGFVWSFLGITGLRSQRKFAPKCSFLVSSPLGHCSFRISWQIPYISEISFLWRHTLVLYSAVLTWFTSYTSITILFIRERLCRTSWHLHFIRFKPIHAKRYVGVVQLVLNKYNRHLKNCKKLPNFNA